MFPNVTKTGTNIQNMQDKLKCYEKWITLMKEQNWQFYARLKKEMTLNTKVNVDQMIVTKAHTFS
jgi:hypothetical protein